MAGQKKFNLMTTSLRGLFFKIKKPSFERVRKAAVTKINTQLVEEQKMKAMEIRLRSGSPFL